MNKQTIDDKVRAGNQPVDLMAELVKIQEEFKIPSIRDVVIDFYAEQCILYDINPYNSEMYYDTQALKNVRKFYKELYQKPVLEIK